ncbi:Disease resistance-like protein CSA1 [Vitis vinifera]|uniref:Disease resistance-like protein CSA1 n=1 Tax=Vitis vinifera TaxID=29760 RepID=A0A438EC10_VITVI|nr:Disease resistance-like protein CSA1 [Vitis vinifera]
MEHLSELSLEGTAVKGLPLSIEYLTGPVLLNLRNCQNPESLPSCIYRLRSLEILILSDCLKLKELPELLEIWEFVGTFLRWNCSKELPSPIQHLSGLVLLNLRECKSLAILPHSICKLKSLQTLIPSGCSKLDNLPEGLGSLQGLEKLGAAGTL